MGHRLAAFSGSTSHFRVRNDDARQYSSFTAHEKAARTICSAWVSSHQMVAGMTDRLHSTQR